MQELINKLDRWLQANRPAYYNSLRSPWENEKFEQIQNLIGTELPEFFRTLYGCKEGQSALIDESLYDNWRYFQFEKYALIINLTTNYMKWVNSTIRIGEI